MVKCGLVLLKSGTYIGHWIVSVPCGRGISRHENVKLPEVALVNCWIRERFIQ